MTPTHLKTRRTTGNQRSIRAKAARTVVLAAAAVQIMLALSGCGLNDLVADESGHHDVPRGLAELDGLPIRFTEVIDGTTEDIENATERFLAALDSE